MVVYLLNVVYRGSIMRHYAWIDEVLYVCISVKFVSPCQDFLEMFILLMA
jgi:hypothetical protein